MALRNQPYLPLYVQDFLSDERLRECKPESVGVYIFTMCVLHKSEEYGTLLLKQNGEQNSSSIKNFASRLAKHLPYEETIIEIALKDLIDNKVIQIEGAKLIQKRMVKDNYISNLRANAGKKGGEKSVFAKAKVQAKVQANSENENEYENEDVIKDVVKKDVVKKDKDISNDVIGYLNQKLGSGFKATSANKEFISARVKEGAKLDDFKTVIDKKYNQWINTEHSKFLRPQTLFGTKFDSYLNEKVFTGTTPKNLKGKQFEERDYDEKQIEDLYYDYGKEK